MTITIDNVSGPLIFLLLMALGTILFILVRAARHFSDPRVGRFREQSSKEPETAFNRSAAPPFPPLDLAPFTERTEAVFVRTERKTPPTQAQQNAWDKLPPRQKEAAVLVASGLSTRQVANKMHIQVSTVQGYLKETYAALNMRSRAELVNFVRDISLESAPPPTT